MAARSTDLHPRKSISHPFAYHGLPYLLLPIFSAWKQHTHDRKAHDMAAMGWASQTHSSPSLRDMHKVIHAQHLGVRFDGSGGWTPAWTPANSTGPSLSNTPTSVTFGTPASAQTPPGRHVFATPPRTHAPFGAPGATTLPPANSWVASKAQPSSPSVTQPWSTPPRVHSLVTRSSVDIRRGRGRRQLSRWDQPARRAAYPLVDWSAGIDTPA